MLTHHGLLKRLELVFFKSPIGEHLALPKKKSAEKPCFLSDRSKGPYGFSPPVQKARGKRLRGGPQSLLELLELSEPSCRFRWVLHVLLSPKKGRHLALSRKGSAEKPCFHSDRSKGSRSSSSPVQIILEVLWVLHVLIPPIPHGKARRLRCLQN